LVLINKNELALRCGTIRHSVKRVKGWGRSVERKDVKGTYAAPALEKAFEVIEHLAEYPQGMLLSEMAARLGRTVGELFRIVIVMERLGYLRKSATTDRYTVAYKLLDVAMRATPAQHLVRAATPVMQGLALAAGQSCHLVVANGGHGLVDMIVSCSGQVILAFSGEQRAQQIVEAVEQERAAPVDRRALTDSLAIIREQGYDSRRSPITYGVTDISFPVHGFDGNVVAALTIPFLELIDGSQKIGLDAARGLLREAVAAISDTLGYQAG
jgi:DNA-binding IclR family transcriptional regulator